MIRKGNTKMEKYLCVTKTNVDNLGQAGSLVLKRVLISQVLLRLDDVYSLVIVVIQGKSNISWLNMQSELLILYKRLDHQNSQKNIGNITQSLVVHMVQRPSSND